MQVKATTAITAAICFIVFMLLLFLVFIISPDSYRIVTAKLFQRGSEMKRISARQFSGLSVFAKEHFLSDFRMPFLRFLRPGTPVLHFSQIIVPLIGTIYYTT
jgi:hypothetical protein